MLQPAAGGEPGAAGGSQRSAAPCGQINRRAAVTKEPLRPALHAPPAPPLEGSGSSRYRPTALGSPLVRSSTAGPVRVTFFPSFLSSCQSAAEPRCRSSTGKRSSARDPRRTCGRTRRFSSARSRMRSSEPTSEYRRRSRSSRTDGDDSRVTSAPPVNFSPLQQLFCSLLFLFLSS